MDRVPSAHIRKFCRVKNGVNERIGQSALQWFSHVERMENDRITKRVYVGVCAGCCSVSTVRRLRKRRIDTERVFKEKRFGCQVGKENDQG